jgi:hypothetical protein
MLIFATAGVAIVHFLIAVCPNASPVNAFEDLRLTMTLSPSDEDRGSGASSSSTPDVGLIQRLAQAEAVVSGVVLEVSPFQAQTPAFLTHHKPRLVEGHHPGRNGRKKVP